MFKKNQTSSWIMALGLVTVLAAGALVYYQHSAGAFKIIGGSTACPLRQQYGMPVYNVTCVNLGSVAFAQPFTINSINSSGQFKEMVLNLSGASDGLMDAELRSFNPTQKPTDGTVLASTALSTLHIELRDNNKKLAIVASPPLALANGKYVITMVPKPYANVPVNLARVSGDGLTGLIFNGQWTSMQQTYGNLMLSHTLSIPNSVAIDPFADNRFKVAALSTGKKQRAALVFVSTSTKLSSVKVLIDSASPTPVRVNARLMELTAAQVTANNPDAGRRVFDQTQTVTTRDATSVTLILNSITLKVGTTYALVLDTDKVSNAATELWLKAGTSSTDMPTGYTASQAVVYASTDGKTVSWIKDSTRYFSFLISTGPASSPTPTTSPSGISACSAHDFSNAALINGSGAAGTYYYDFSLTNLSSQSCTVTGPPKVTALNSTGVTVGQTIVAPHTSTTVTVAPGAKIYSQIGFPSSGNFASGVCKPMKSLVFLVPDQTSGFTIQNIDSYNSVYTGQYCQDLNVSDFSTTP